MYCLNDEKQSFSGLFTWVIIKITNKFHMFHGESALYVVRHMGLWTYLFYSLHSTDFQKTSDGRRGRRGRTPSSYNCLYPPSVSKLSLVVRPAEYFPFCLYSSRSNAQGPIQFKRFRLIPICSAHACDLLQNDCTHSTRDFTVDHYWTLLYTFLNSSGNLNG